MKVFEVAGDSVKSVMNHLLKGSAFDGFLVRGIEVSVFTKVEISGIIDKNYYPEDQRAALNRNYVYWSEIKPFVLSLVKGGRTPNTLKIIFSMSDNEVSALHNNASALFFNLLYEEGVLRFTAAVGQKKFSLDKSEDTAWDAYIKGFFNKYKWAVSTLT